MKKNLFIAASPLQLLNAVEAKEKFKTTNNTLILMFNTSTNITDHKQKEKLLNQKDWDEIIYYNKADIPKAKRFPEQIKLIKSLLKFQYYYIFSGEFGTMNHIIMANLKSEHIYLIDDGNATLFTYKRLTDINYFSKINFSRKIRLYRYMLVGLKYTIHQNINFFTTFNITSLEHINVIAHNFEYLKSNTLQKCNISDSVYILGQNLAEVNFMKKEVYLTYLQKIKQHYKEDIIYIPHRSEIIDDRYNYLLDSSFKIQTTTGPIEATFLSDNIYPKMIISFISSALFNLDKIFTDSEIHAIKIATEDILSSHKLIQSCYDFFDNTGVKIIDLN